MPRRWGKSQPSDAVLTVGVKQGAGATVPVAFGPPPPPGCGKKQGQRSRKRRNRSGKQQSRGGANLSHWDAFAPQHLALPRAVAPYTVIRTTAIWSPDTDDERRFALFGPSLDVSIDAGQWTAAYCVGANKPLTELQSAPAGVRWYSFESMLTGSWQAASVVPSAFSIQVLNPEALQTTSGMVYIGRCKNKVHMSVGNNNATFKTLAEDLVSYSNPRMCSAGKLGLRGVQVDGVPNNMSELAKFTSLRQYGGGDYTLGPANGLHQDGFNPIFIYNPGAVKLQVLVCCEWRVRFDPSNPAYAACRMHKPSTDSSWSNNLEKAVAAGSGVMDIVEKVARVGRAAGYL